jgi:hypothetical protein
MIKLLILHWTAGADGLNQKEEDSYNEIVFNDGTWVPGTFPDEAQIPPLRPGQYAAHTLNGNSYAKGIAIDAMAGARERPFNPGFNPITEAGLKALVNRAAVNAIKYKLPVTRKTILTHAEVQRTLGIRQNAKWDIMWLPGMTRVDDPIVVGDEIRRQVKEEIERLNAPTAVKIEQEAKAWGIGIAAAVAAIFAFLRGMKK